MSAISRRTLLGASAAAWAARSRRTGWPGRAGCILVLERGRRWPVTAAGDIFPPFLPPTGARPT